MSEKTSSGIGSRLCDELAWYGSQDGLYFTTSFWWKLDLLWQSRPFYDRSEPDLAMRWAKVLDLCFCIAGYGLCLISYQWISEVAILLLAIETNLPTGTLDLQALDSDLRRINAQDPLQEFAGKLFYTRSLGLAHYFVHDAIVFLLTRFDKSLAAQIFVEIVVDHFLSPLHAFVTQGAIVVGGVPVPIGIGLAKILAWSAAIASMARIASVLATVWTLRQLTRGRQSLAEIRVTEAVGIIVMVVIPWLALATPASLVLYLTEISLIPQGIATQQPITRLGFLTEDSRYQLFITWWSWQLVTASKLKIVAVQMLFHGVVTFLASGALRRL